MASDVYDYVVPSGVIVPDTADLRTVVEGEYKAAFGADLDTSANTPQGVLITTETVARDAMVRNNAAVANQINPDQSGGIFLDALWSLTGGHRIGETKTVVRGVTLAGQPSTIIPAGAQASLGAGGEIFETTGTVTLGPGGTITADFQALNGGPIAVGIGDLDTIVTGNVLGWETVTNPAAGIPGITEETDIASRTRRRQTLALQSTAMVEAIVSGLYDTAGVTSVLYRENVTAGSITIEGVTLVEHSILAVVDGGTDLDVATTLLNKKSGGCNWNGTTTVNVTEPISGQIYPVKFTRPTIVPIYAAVTVRQGAAIGNPQEVVRQAVTDYANGLLEGETGFGIGDDVSPFELAGAVNRESPALFVTSFGISTDPLGPFDTDVIDITIVERAQILSGSISVTVV